MSTNKHKHKLSDLRKFAGTLGLEIAKYNPGDRTRYKIVPISKGYFETDGFYRPATLSEAHAFLAGLADAKHVLAQRKEGGAQ